jgi:hypothetical protein
VKEALFFSSYTAAPGQKITASAFLARSDEKNERIRSSEIQRAQEQALLGTISRKMSDSTDKSNGQNPLDIAITNALELLRGQNFEN